MTRGMKRVSPVTKNFDTRIDIHNRFDIEVIDSRTGVKRKEARAYNLICDKMWTELEKSRTTSKHMWFYKIAYGRGTGTPSASDTDLFSPISSVTAENLTYGVDYPNATCWIRKSITIDELTSVGETISEIGIRSYGNVLCTHAMLQDMNGNPISIEKGDTDILNIYATVYVHFSPELVDVNNPIQVDLRSVRSTYSFIRWLAGDVNSSNYYSKGGLRIFGPIKGRLEGNDQYSLTSYGSFNWVSAAVSYDAANKKYTLTGRSPYSDNNNFKGLGWWTILSGNYLSSYGKYEMPQVAIKAAPPVFNGSTVLQESVGTGDGTTVDFATKFDYPTNAKVYVDGEIVNDVVVSREPLYSNNMGQYFEAIEVADGKAYPTFNYTSSMYGMVMGSIDNVFLGGSTNLFYNPNWQFGITSFRLQYYKYKNVAVSDDLVNWHYIYGSETSTGLGNTTVTVPAEHRYKKYWRFNVSDTKSANTYSFVATDITGKNIHFATPPSEGAVITIDYETPVIAKDANHVFDLSFSIYLGEYNDSV